MTLDEAIKHAIEVAEKHEKRLKVYENLDEDRPLFSEEETECRLCAEEHRQLATWLKELKQLREQMSYSEKSNKWIPISESIPPIGQDVLVCDLDGDMYITYLHLNGTWGFEYCGNKIKNVVAWQELPAPFKPQERDDENCDDILESIYAERDGKK